MTTTLGLDHTDDSEDTMPKAAANQIRHILAVALIAHRILTTDQAHALVAHLGRQPQWTAKILLRMRREGEIESMPQSPARANLPHLHWATPSLIETMYGDKDLEDVRVVQVTEKAVRKDTLAHSLAINDAALIFHAASRMHGGVTTWLHEKAHALKERPGRGDYANTDALIHFDCQNGGKSGTLPILMELDRGSKTLGQIVDQTNRYLIHRSLMAKTRADQPPRALWEDTYRRNAGPADGFPQLLWVFDCPNAEKRLSDFARAIADPAVNVELAAALDTKLWVQATTMTRLRRFTPYGPAFTNPRDLNPDQLTAGVLAPRRDIFGQAFPPRD